MKKTEWMMNDWSWYFTGSSRDETTLGDIWLEAKRMTTEILKKDEDAEIWLCVCDHELAFTHVHGVIKTSLGQNKLKKHWRMGNTHFKKFDHKKKHGLWDYVARQQKGDAVTHREEHREQEEL